MKCKKRIFWLYAETYSYQAHTYARELKFCGRVRALEPAIARSPRTAYYYARELMNANDGKAVRILVIERGISLDGEWALRYVKNILKRRFPVGEHRMFESHWRQQEYENFIHQQEQEERDQGENLWTRTADGLVAGEPVRDRSRSRHADAGAYVGH